MAAKKPPEKGVKERQGGKRSSDHRKRFLKALEGGQTRLAACAVAGFSDEHLRRWMADDVDFVAAVKEAEGKAEQKMAALIVKAAPKNWQAAAWWLERRRHEAYGRKDKLVVEQAVKDELGEIYRRLRDSLPPEDYARVIQVLSAGASGVSTG